MYDVVDNAFRRRTLYIIYAIIGIFTSFVYYDERFVLNPHITLFYGHKLIRTM